jgi:GNAT superfamily N-acetyltransferase
LQLKILVANSAKLPHLFPLFSQLRPHLSEQQFIEQVVRQMKNGYQIAYVEDENKIVAAAGFRLTEVLHWGKAVYVDDLITDKNSRGKGYAGKLFDWLVNFAKENNCDSLHLDSGTKPERYDAHRFYLKKGMNITSHHFALKLK